jgi:membrane associated rhomboid family serine protease
MVFPLADLEKTRIIPFATYGLIVLNVVAYLVKYEKGDEFAVAYAATPYEITHNVDITEPIPLPAGRDAVIDQAPVPFPVWLTLFTSMFLHGSPLHLAGNMIYLWIFGDNVEEVLGRLRYVVFYLTCGLVGTVTQVVANPDSVVPIVGASGAIAGVMGAYVVWFPHNRVRVLVLWYVTEMPALLAIGLWILIQLWEGVGSFGQHGGWEGVAYLAHVGGAATGLFVGWLYYDRAQLIHSMNEAQEGWFEGPDGP